MLLNCSLFSSPSSRRFFLCPSVHIIMFLGLGALQLVIYHGVAPSYDFYALLFCFILLFITSCNDNYSFVLCCSPLSTSSVTCTCTSPKYLVRCIPALHVVLLPCYSAELPLPVPLLFCFRLSFINLILAFLTLPSCVFLCCCHRG